MMLDVKIFNPDCDTALGGFAARMATAGCHVTMFGGHAVPGVKIEPMETFVSSALTDPHDITIVAHNKTLLHHGFANLASFLWVSDRRKVEGIITPDDAMIAASSPDARAMPYPMRTWPLAEIADPVDFFINRIHKAIPAEAAPLVAQMVRNSDIIAARAVFMAMAEDGNLHARTDLADLMRDYAWIDDGDQFREHYGDISATHGGVWEDHSGDQRFKWIAGHVDSEIRQLARPGIANVLDYGCAYGYHTIALTKAVRECRIVGIDLDERTLEWARRYVAGNCGGAGVPSFSNPEDGSELKGACDVVIMAELLEHQPRPWDLANEIERYAVDRGLMVATVPYGPHEYASYKTYPHRAHLWHFTKHDLRDMFGKKPGFKLETMPQGLSPLTGEALGFHLMTWRADHQPAGQIDMDRKLTMQRVL